MGQRHMTYVLVKNGSHKNLGALYNQWNPEDEQPYKVLRFMKAIRTWNKNKSLFLDPQEVCLAYQYAASIHPGGMCRFSLENEQYDSRYGMYCEDNNNGWQIVAVTIKEDSIGKTKVKVSIGFKPGYEWGNDFESKGYLSLKDYLDGYFADGRHETKSFEDYLGKFSKADQKLLNEINDDFDDTEIKETEKMIAAEIQKLQEFNTQKQAKLKAVAIDNVASV